MGIFSRRKAAVAEATAWQPVDTEEFTGEDADMDDDGQATTDEGFWVSEVTFGGDAGTSAQIVASIYLTYAEGDEGYRLGLRYQYVTDADPDWTYIGYTDDPGGELFGYLHEAQESAREWAAGLAGQDDDSRRLLPDVFEWDGEPFPAGDPG